MKKTKPKKPTSRDIVTILVWSDHAIEIRKVAKETADLWVAHLQRKLGIDNAADEANWVVLEGNIPAQIVTVEAC